MVVKLDNQGKLAQRAELKKNGKLRNFVNFGINPRKTELDPRKEFILANN